MLACYTCYSCSSSKGLACYSCRLAYGQRILSCYLATCVQATGNASHRRTSRTRRPPCGGFPRCDVNTPHVLWRAFIAFVCGAPLSPTSVPASGGASLDPALLFGMVGELKHSPPRGSRANRSERQAMHTSYAYPVPPPRHWARHPAWPLTSHGYRRKLAAAARKSPRASSFLFPPSTSAWAARFSPSAQTDHLPSHRGRLTLVL